jgi:hypothetical protein
MATVNVGASSVRMRPGRNAGIWHVRQAGGMPPKRDPMVATGSCQHAGATVPPMSATM